MKTNKVLTKGQIIGERHDSIQKILNAYQKSKTLNLSELQKKTKLDAIKTIQAVSMLWASGEMSHINPETQKESYYNGQMNRDDYMFQLGKWATSRHDFKNDDEYLFATLTLFPASTFEELSVLTDLNEHNLCVAIKRLFNKNRINVDEDELFFPAGLFDFEAVR